ncbi:hypothetical protein MMC14_009383 [Varicellaria rhodocarpa]|nr:hypothetical protein [Varicellaria rhodocarpa]
MDFPLSHLIALFFIVFVFPTVEGAGNASASSAIPLIVNKLNLYSVLIDTKNYKALDQVFTQDASPLAMLAPTGRYPNNITGIELYLQDSLDDAVTLHFSDTQYVDVGPTGKTATATSYGQAVYFAKDVSVTGQICTVYTTYTDKFVLKGDQWLSQQKNLFVTAIIGNTSVIPPFPTG